MLPVSFLTPPGRERRAEPDGRGAPQSEPWLASEQAVSRHILGQETRIQ